MSITCSFCGRTSHSPVDVATGWCSCCKRFTGKCAADVRAAAITLRKQGDSGVAESVLYRLRTYGALCEPLGIDSLWPRDEDHRYRLYGRTGDDLRVLCACPEAGGIGQAIVTLQSEYPPEEWAAMQIGVLDVMPGGEPSETGTWLIKPFQRGDHI